MATIYLIDGSNLLFRAFYAIRHLSNSQGFPTNGIYGFTQMLWKFLKTCAPTHAAVVFDTKEPTFRHALSADYKANRAEPPDTLVPQFPYFRRIADALGFPVLELPGFEADDIIGTLATRLGAQGHDVIIMTGDKDFMQLVGEHVTLWDTMKEVRTDAAGVRKRFGVEPSQVVDVQGLAGDAVDNVRGVPGIGEKTAITLIREWGSLDAVLAHAQEIKGKLGERLAGHAKDARLAKTLCTIHTDVPLAQDLPALAVAGIRREAAGALLAELEFHTLLAELAPQQTLSAARYTLITDRAALETVVQSIRQAGRCALDTETIGLNPHRAPLVGIALAWQPGEAAYLPLAHGAGEQLALDSAVAVLAGVCADPQIAKYFQHAKFDLPVLARHGLPVRGMVCDTMLASYLLDPGEKHGLDALAQKYLHHTPIRYSEVVGKALGRTDFSQVPLAEACAYAAEDADVTFQLAQHFLPQLAPAGVDRLLREIELPLVDVLIGMEAHGMLVDCALLARLDGEFRTRLQGLEAEIYASAGQPFNINSPRQLGEILFTTLHLPGARRTKTGFSTDARVLEKLADVHPLPRLVLAYRTLNKLLSTYVEALPKLVDAATGRIHTTLHQTMTATGRLSSSDPNLQNIPVKTEAGRRIRQAFMAPPGFLLLAADYSQIELRILAHVSGDARLCHAFAHGVDVHTQTAAALFGVPEADVTAAQRASGKTVNFSVIYGQGAYGLAGQLQIDAEAAAQYIAHYFATYPGVAVYRQQVLDSARARGEVRTLFGRRRAVPGLTSDQPAVRAEAERIAFNTVVQGTAADVIKVAMVAIATRLHTSGSRAVLLLQIHDELLFEVPQEALTMVQTWVREAMEGVRPPDGVFRVPLVVDVQTGKNWAEVG